MRARLKASPPSVWAETLRNEDDRIAKIHLKDGRRVTGRLHRYSTDPVGDYIYLSKPVWGDNCDYIQSDAHGALLKCEDIDFIEFSLKKKEAK
jgi:hypothetical protein